MISKKMAKGRARTIAMLAVGLWVSSRIEQGVLQTSADAAADYVKTFVAPHGADLEQSQPLSVLRRRSMVPTPALQVVLDALRGIEL